MLLTEPVTDHYSNSAFPRLLCLAERGVTYILCPVQAVASVPADAEGAPPSAPPPSRTVAGWALARGHGPLCLHLRNLGAVKKAPDCLGGPVAQRQMAASTGGCCRLRDTHWVTSNFHAAFHSCLDHCLAASQAHFLLPCGGESRFTVCQSTWPLMTRLTESGHALRWQKRATDGRANTNGHFG